MPVLLHLQTEDFEFTVWANDISPRQQALDKTLSKRNNPQADSKSEPISTMRFSPPLILNPINEAERSKLISEYDLPKNIFFENTQYLFEWVFLKSVTSAKVAHRSRTVHDAFRFLEQRDSFHARLTGTINTGNDVGWLRLPLSYHLEGNTVVQHFSFEVLPTKMLIHKDLPAMYQAIDQFFPLWRFSLVEKTEQDAAKGKQRGHFPLMWLANFGRLRQQLEQALKVITQAPHSRLQSYTTYSKAARLKGRLSHKLSETIQQDFANKNYGKHYRIEKKKLSVDTPENRFIKMVVSHSKRQLIEFEQRLRENNKAPDQQRLSESFLDELNTWQLPLQKTLQQSFLKEVGQHSNLHRESLVLQQKSGYSTVYRVWQELKFYLDVFSSQSSISMKSVAEIYEVWCFLRIKQILIDELGFQLINKHNGQLELNNFFEYRLQDGFAGAFQFTRSDGVTARLAHEPVFSKKSSPIRSYWVSQEPDIVLEVSFPTHQANETSKKFIWLFDAKYRIKTDREQSDDIEDIDQQDFVPNDAINQMHRYRDALIHLEYENTDKPSFSYHKMKTRPIFGAFALYPGFFDQENDINPYALPIKEVGIGAFALLPSDGDSRGGSAWLIKFLKQQIGDIPKTIPRSLAENTPEYLYARESARIPNYGMQQTLYHDLTMSVALGTSERRSPDYFNRFISGALTHYHIPKSTFSLKFHTHVVHEIKFLIIISDYLGSEPISQVWPVQSVQQMPRNKIDATITGKPSSSSQLYFLFKLGQPLLLKTPISYQSNGTFRNTLKLTTLQKLEEAKSFCQIKSVYKEALV